VRVILERERAPGAPKSGGGRSNWQRYGDYLRRAPELSVAWNDAETGARGWLVVNSWRGGAAGGGTRMRPGVHPREVIYLAKAMELKFSLAGPPIGGAKSGIDFDPRDPRKGDVLERWWRAIQPLLERRYGTGGDLNVDEVADVIPTFERIGLFHPQQGVVTGHLNPDPDSFRGIMARMNAGVEAEVDGDFGVDRMPMTVADMITGFGVALSAWRLLEKQGRSVEGARVLMEGFGNVGAACALYLARAGARIVSISDARQTLVDPDGVDAAGIEALVRDREDKMIPSSHPGVRPATADRDRFWSEPADVFVCAAISESVSEETLDRLDACGVSVIACGANQPFRERAIGSTRVARLADRRFSIAADIVANCGMARTFSYLMEQDAGADCASIVRAVEATIDTTLDEVFDRAGRRRGAPTAGRRTTGLLGASLGLALDRIGGA
jgi:glutamate dehydrogenase/leucine dehydrogenase